MRILTDTQDGQPVVIYVPAPREETTPLVKLLTARRGIRSVILGDAGTAVVVWRFLADAYSLERRRQEIQDCVQQVLLLPPDQTVTMIFAFHAGRPLTVHPAIGVLWTASNFQGTPSLIYPHPHTVLINRLQANTPRTGGEIVYLWGDLIVKAQAHESALPRWNGGRARRFDAAEFDMARWLRDCRGDA